MIIKYSVIISLLIVSKICIADTFVAGVETTIINVTTYNHGGASGDMRILVQDTVAGCESGYFLTKEDAGIDRTLSVALSAYHAGEKVRVGGRSGVAWNGSGDPKYCKIHAIELLKQ